MANSVDELFKFEINKFILELNKQFDIDISSIGFTSYIYNEVDSYSKMATLSLESQEFNDANMGFINQFGSSITPSDFKENDPEHLRYNEKIKKNIPDKSSKLIYFEPISFNHELKYDGFFSLKNIKYNSDVLRIDGKNTFNNWVNFVNTKVGGYSFLKQTFHHNIDDEYILGVTCFLINIKESNFKGNIDVFYAKILRFISDCNNLLYFQSLALLSFSGDIKIKNKELKQKSIKSSLAAVMARNQSHNIGSHVLSRFSQGADITYVLKEYKDAQFVDYDCIKNNDWEKSYLDNLTEKQKQWKKGLLELTHDYIAVFNNYMKERQELLAEITSTVPQIQTNKSLKAVLDGFTNNRILLDRISGIDNFKFTFKLDVQLGEDYEENDVLVAVANDVLGQQALYIILENLIRNTAKHGSKLAKNKRLPDKIIFTIRVRESTLDSAFYQVTVFDNVKANIEENVPLKNVDPEFFKTYYKDVTKQSSSCKGCNDDDHTNHNYTIDPLTRLIVDQNELINRNILNDDSELRSEALGLIEMEACAAYLRKLPIEEIENPKFNLEFLDGMRKNLKKEIIAGEKEVRILRAVNPLTNKGIEKLENETDKNDKEAIKKNYSNREKVLGYRFYLPKPQELLIIDTNNELFNSIEGDKKEKLKTAQRNGVLLVAKGLTEEFKYYNFDKNKIYPHEQLLVIGQLDNEDRISKSFLPKRRLDIKYEEDDNLIQLFKQGNYKVLKEQILFLIVKKKFTCNEIKPAKLSFSKIIDLNNLSLNKYYVNPNDSHGELYNSFKDGYSQITTHKERDFVKSKIEFEKDKSHKDIANVTSERLKFLDSVLNNVLVLDERIQEKAETRYSLEKNTNRTNISYREVWQNLGCFIPWKDKREESVDLSSSNFKDTKNNISDWIDSLRAKKLLIEVNDKGETEIIENRTYSNIDTLIIHLGIIEKCLAAEEGKDKNSVKDKEDFLKDILGEDFEDVNVILTSGRAPKKENMIPGCSFLTISIVTDYLINNRFKYSLNELCNLARPKI